MTFPSDHPEPSPREDLPQGLQIDLKRAYRADEIQPPSRVDDAVFAAAAKHFSEDASSDATSGPASQAEPKPGVLARLGRRPLQSAGLVGGLLAASVLLIVFIGGPSQSPNANERSIAMDNFAESAAKSADESTHSLRASELESDPQSGRALSGAGGGGGAISSERTRRSADSPAEDAMFGLALRDGGILQTESEVALVPPPAPSMAPTSQLRSADVNGDGSVNIADALLLARMVDDAGGSLDDLHYDLLGNGTVSRADADAIARLVVRLAPVPENTNTEGAS